MHGATTVAIAANMILRVIGKLDHSMTTFTYYTRNRAVQQTANIAGVVKIG